MEATSANYLLLCNYYYLCSEPVREDVSYNRAFLQQPISVQQAVASSRAPRKKHSMRDVRIARVTRLVVKPVVLYEPELAPLQVTGTQGRARGAGKDKASNHCLYHILPPQRPLHDALRVRGHQFQLPNCIYKFHKQSFIVSSLFRFLN